MLVKKLLKYIMQILKNLKNKYFEYKYFSNNEIYNANPEKFNNLD